MTTGTKLAAALVAYHNAIEPRIPPGLRSPAGVAVAVASLAAGRRRGMSRQELAVARGQLRDGLRWGLACAGAATVSTAALLTAPRTRALFRDRRVDHARLASDALLRIPVATALVEEAIFRGALYGLLRRESGRRVALAGSSIAFGLWHVAPALAQLEANRPGASRKDRARVVAMHVMGTAIGGIALAWLRERTDGILAPAIAHWAANTLAAIGAVVAR